MGVLTVILSCNICNEGVDDEHSIKLHIYDKHEDITLDILNRDELTDAEEAKCVKVILNSTGPYRYSICPLLGYFKIFISSNSWQLEEHILQHNEENSKSMYLLLLKKTCIFNINEENCNE